jgi:catechol 2,3-dioxygenase-like lactoylglutathione lyase family enzyme
MNVETNVKQVVPFFGVSDIEESLRYYVDGLGFQMTSKWVDEGKLRWCWLEYGGSMFRSPSSGTRCGSHL